MPDDLLGTVRAHQHTRHALRIGTGGSAYDEAVREIDALLARVEQAEAERDTYREQAARLRKLLEGDHA